MENTDITFDQYQTEATALAVYPGRGYNLLYPALGCAGEAGEIADKVKKLWRDKDKTTGQQLTGDEKNALVKEIGDNLWYLAALCDELGIRLVDVAAINIQKLKDRTVRGVIKGEGDER